MHQEETQMKVFLSWYKRCKRLECQEMSFLMAYTWSLLGSLRIISFLLRYYIITLACSLLL